MLAVLGAAACGGSDQAPAGTVVEVALGFVLVAGISRTFDSSAAVATAGAVAAALALAATRRWLPAIGLGAALLTLAQVLAPFPQPVLLESRTFFGVYRVQEANDPTGTFRVLMHGTTLHGSQRFLDEDGQPVDDTVPTTYYYPGSPMGRMIAKRREILAAAGIHVCESPAELGSTVVAALKK